VGALIALLCSIILIWRMYAGMLDQKTYNYLTAILQIPQWTAYLPILISLVLLALAAIVTTIEETSTIKNGNDHV
jgi:TRAP-type C4-dicarboxylate transport system permease small subunit